MLSQHTISTGGCVLLHYVVLTSNDDEGLIVGQYLDYKGMSLFPAVITQGERWTSYLFL